MTIPMLSTPPVTGGLHQTVPADVKAEAEQLAKDSLQESDTEDD